MLLCEGSDGGSWSGVLSGAVLASGGSSAAKPPAEAGAAIGRLAGIGLALVSIEVGTKSIFSETFV